MPKIGAHTSAAGGLFKGIENGEIIGADVVQIFGASPRQYSARLPGKEEIQKFHETLKKSSVKAVYLHAAYLVNLGSPDSSAREKSLKNLATHYEIANLLEAEGIIFHLGSGKELPKSDSIKFIAEGMKEILKRVPGDTKLLMENSAGGGAKIGSIAEDLRILLEQVHSPRVGICFDTAHAFEAGIIESYTKENIKKLLDEWDKEIGLENLAALHVNDSKTIHNSHHDRHENIGEGHIGLDGFKNLAKEARLKNLPWILEVPGIEGLGPDKANIDILKSLF